jgi:hypothetical protein
MNMSGRGEIAIRTTGSARLRWLDTSSTPPDRGKRSSPETLDRVKTDLTKMQKARIGA